MALMHCQFFSNVLGMAVSMDVILPQPANLPNEKKSAALRKKWPVLYLLHGRSDDHTIWQRRTSIERYVADKELAVIMPNAERSWYTDTASGQRYWTFVSEELPVIARSFFPLSEARKDNFVAGLSMGGYGAFKLALRCPEKFAAAASLSGALDVDARILKASKEELREWKSIFGLRVANTENDLFALARKLAKSSLPKPKMYQWCGTEDFLYQHNIRFRDYARKLALPLTYEEGPGNHEWGSWDRMIQRVLDWLPIK